MSGPGACMQVWPVMHSKLTKRGLKSISGEEVCTHMCRNQRLCLSSNLLQWMNAKMCAPTGAAPAEEGSNHPGCVSHA